MSAIDPSMMPEVVSQVTVGEIVKGIAFLVGATGAVVYIRRVTRPTWQAFVNFLEDWNGEPKRPGVQSRPGVMERLERLESLSLEVHHEIKPNGGNSMNDKVTRIDKRGRDKDALIPKQPRQPYLDL
jgi:hypothetical protein